MNLVLCVQFLGESKMGATLKEKAVTSLIWKFIEKFGAQLMQFVVSIVLARMLMPEDYGIIAITTVFLAIANVFIDSGFSSILIRKLDADDLDYSTVFYFNLCVSIILYILFFFVLSPLLSKVYEIQELTDVLRILALILIMSPLNSMQRTILSKRLLFRRLFLSTFSATVVAAAVGITMAYFGFGVWALVAQQLCSTGVSMIVMMFTVRWRPKLMFSFKRLKSLYSLGWKFFTVSLVNVTYDNIHSIIIGKKYDETNLAYWTKGRQIPGLIVDNINGTVGSVLFPVMAQRQDNLESLKKIVKTGVKTLSYVIWPMMTGLFVCSDSLIRFLLGDQWLESAFYLRIFSIYFALIPLVTIGQTLFQVLGKGNLLIITEVIKKTCGLAILITAMFFGLKWIALGLILDVVLSFIIATLPCKKLINYSIINIIIDVLPNLLVCALMGTGVYLLSFIDMDYRIQLFLQIFTGIALYVILSIVFRLSSFKFIWDYIKRGIKKIKDHKLIAKKDTENTFDNGSGSSTANDINNENFDTNLDPGKGEKLKAGDSKNEEENSAQTQDAPAQENNADADKNNPSDGESAE